LREFGEALPRIRRHVAAQLGGAATPTRERVLATIVRLLDTTWLRIGNDRYRRENGSHGLSTLRRRHAVFEGQQLRLSFRGKSGVRQEAAVSDRRITRIVQRCRELPGQELFCYVDADGEVHGIGSADVNRWLAAAAGHTITAKDFRTWHGSVLALQRVLKGCASVAGGAGDERPTARLVVDHVASQLGNTPAVCRKAYIHPIVLSLCDTLADATDSAALLRRPWARRPHAASGLKVDECRLLALLRSASHPTSLQTAAAGARQKPRRHG
jgi:DNA topoisomerase-1